MSEEFDIGKIEKGKYIILKLKGRIAAESSLRLIEAVNEEIKRGARDMILDVADVDYISSAGVRVLLLSYKQLHNLKGTFALYRATDTVRSLLNTMNLTELAESSKFEADMNIGVAVPDYGTVNGLDVNVLFRSDSMSDLKIIGNIDKSNDLSYSAQDINRLEHGPKTIAFGLGAFDTNVKPMIERAGEFISIGDFAIFMPSDGSKNPEYLIAKNGLLPEVNYLYCAVCECDYSAAFTFTGAAAGAPVRFGDIIKTAHGVADREIILAVVIGDVEKVVGCSLAIPPGINRKNNAQMKEKFILTGEGAYDGHTVLCAGVSSTQPVLSAASKFIKTLEVSDAIISGHFHAAVFASTPFAKELRDPAGPIRELYEKAEPKALLHLTNNLSDVNCAVGETEFISGTCWIVNLSCLES